MKEPLRRDSNSISLATFWENYQLGKYDFNPPYQRHSVWSEEKKSFLINSILLNYPVPPIFLREQIEDESGKTMYQVIDGKQRLTSIIEFIGGFIPVSDEEDDGVIGGKYFDELSAELSEYRRRFWRYVIPVEYIDTDDQKTVDGIFDRLNRNGEPLRGQELRNAKYHTTELLKAVNNLKTIPFWIERLKITDAQRMEDDEFISELFLYLIEGEIFGSNQEILDALYEKNAALTAEEILVYKERFVEYTKFLSDLDVDYDKYKVGGVSHLLGLWMLVGDIFGNTDPKDTGMALNSMYSELRSQKNPDEPLKSYKNSMYSRTKNKNQREKRLRSIKQYLNI